MLSEWSDLREALALEKVPHYSTLCYAHRRLLKKGGFLQLLAAAFQRARQLGLLKDRSALVALDSTGMESRHVSHYYGQRKGLRKSRFPKLSAVCDVDSHLFLSGVADRGPHGDDQEFQAVVRQAYALQPFAHLVADAGYDAEHHHRFLRRRLGARSTIPPLPGRPTEKPPTQPCRREMATTFDQEAYGQRWQVESAFSQCKRRLGSALRSRIYWSQCREGLFRLLVHNLMVIRPPASFQQSNYAPIFPRA